MTKKIAPIDVIMAKPESLKKIVPACERDKALLDTLEWGFALHPDEENNTVPIDIDESTVIDWSDTPGLEDVRAFVKNSTMPSRFPIAGPAEHVISLRRLCNAQPDEIRSGDAWRHGTSQHLKDLLDNE